MLLKLKTIASVFAAVLLAVYSAYGQNSSSQLSPLLQNHYSGLKIQDSRLTTQYSVLSTQRSALSTQTPAYKIAKLKYNGGGDWYANKTSLPNLIKFCNQNIKTNIALEEDIVEVGSPEIFSYPFIHMTGHGNVIFSNEEALNLRNYLLGGGFLHVDDNFGLDKFIRLEMKKVFPELDFIEIPFTHPIYHQKFKFPNGLPKIHEHDGKAPKGYGIVYEGRLVCFYTYETDLGNGWEDQTIHNDPEEIRQKALQMGANILSYALTSY